MFDWFGTQIQSQAVAPKTRIDVRHIRWRPGESINILL